MEVTPLVVPVLGHTHAEEMPRDCHDRCQLSSFQARHGRNLNACRLQKRPVMTTNLEQLLYNPSLEHSNKQTQQEMAGGVR